MNYAETTIIFVFYVFQLSGLGIIQTLAASARCLTNQVESNNLISAQKKFMLDTEEFLKQSLE